MFIRKRGFTVVGGFIKILGREYNVSAEVLTNFVERLWVWLVSIAGESVVEQELPSNYCLWKNLQKLVLRCRIINETSELTWYYWFSCVFLFQTNMFKIVLRFCMLSLSCLRSISKSSIPFYQFIAYSSHLSWLLMLKWVVMNSK